MTTAALQPLHDLVRIEANEVTPFDEWDSALRNESPHVAHVDPEVLREFGDVHQLGNLSV